MQKPVYGPPARQKSTSGIFSTFSTLIVLGATTVVTTSVGSVFQYVSWFNSTRLDAASHRAKRASEVYEKVAQAIGKRYYSTYLYLAAVRDVVNISNREGELAKFYIQLSHQRLGQFHRELQSWNENYDKLLTAVDFDLDAPFGIAERVEYAKVAKINCVDRMVDQFAPHQLNYNSLKIQLAAINHCFVESTAEFNAERDHALVDSAYRIEETKKQRANTAINNVSAMANEFRCHAQFRIKFLEAERQTIVFPLRWFARGGLDKHTAPAFFEAAREKCKFSK